MQRAALAFSRASGARRRPVELDVVERGGIPERLDVRHRRDAGQRRANVGLDSLGEIVRLSHRPPSRHEHVQGDERASSRRPRRSRPRRAPPGRSVARPPPRRSTRRPAGSTLPRCRPRSNSAFSWPNRCRSSGGVIAQRSAASAISAATRFTIDSSASDSSATEPVNCHAKSFSPIVTTAAATESQSSRSRCGGAAEASTGTDPPTGRARAGSASSPRRPTGRRSRGRRKRASRRA